MSEEELRQLESILLKFCQYECERECDKCVFNNTPNDNKNILFCNMLEELSHKFKEEEK